MGVCYVGTRNEGSQLVIVSMTTPDEDEEQVRLRDAAIGGVAVPSGEEETGGVDQDEDSSLVEVYADRLCAVTHALALCCSSVQKASKK